MILLEGASDVAAVRVLAHTRGLGTAVDEGSIAAVSLDGVTNMRTGIVTARERHPEARVLGLCDAREQQVAVRALIATGVLAEGAGADDLPGAGFFVCHDDLEEELMRALGRDGVEAAIETLGLQPALLAFQRQEAWRGRPFEEQVHRFCAVASGRKIAMAGAMGAGLSVEQIPAPIAALLSRAASALRGDD